MILALADGHPALVTNIAIPEHRVQDPECTVNMIPALDNQSLLIGGKFAEVGYVPVFNEDEVNIYDGRTATITMSENAVMKG